MTETAQDVIMISSSDDSDDDSDCQIVKISPSFGGRSKRKMRWQYQPHKMSRSRRRRIIRGQNEDIDDDDLYTEPTSRRNTQDMEADVTAVSGDAAGNGNSMADHSSNNEMSDAKAGRSMMMRADPTDHLANRHHTADLEPTSMLPPPFPSQTADPSNQILLLDDDDNQQETRSRSCSVATLNFFSEGADAQRGHTQGINTDTLDEQRQRVLEEATNLFDRATDPRPTANSAVLRHEDGSILALESLAEGSNGHVVKMEEPQSVEADSLQRYNSAPTASRSRLPRVGKRRAWSSIINFAAYENMLGPLFTRQKETIHPVTYDDMIWGRAERREREK